MNPNTQKSLETHTDEALALIRDPNESDAQLAQVIDFPQRTATEAVPQYGDEAIEDYRESVDERDASAPSDRLRVIDRFKRIGSGILAATALTGVLATGISQVAGADSASKDVPTRTDVAHTGDTLWDMAGNVKNVEDRRDVVGWIQDNNPNLADGLGVGEPVNVPLDAKDIK